MQGRENTSGDLMALRWVSTVPIVFVSLSLKSCRMQRLLDPPGSAYRSETGGLMEALRVLTPEQSSYYPFCGVHADEVVHSTKVPLQLLCAP